jgi:hypothetical protein
MTPVAGSVGDVRVEVVARLRARRPELVRAIFARVRDGAFGSIGAQDTEYVTGLREAVAAAIEYGLDGIEQGGDRHAPIPAAVLCQARRAARVGVSLDTVLRRYVVGHSLLEEFVLEEADRDAIPGERDTLRRALRAQASALDRLIVAVSGAYLEERAQMAPRADDTLALPVMLSNPSARRARECLLFLASHPGASNREVAAGIGVTHQPQISRLLSCLARENLLSKQSEGAGRRNAWWLTPRGERVAHRLLGVGSVE